MNKAAYIIVVREEIVAKDLSRKEAREKAQRLRINGVPAFVYYLNDYVKYISPIKAVQK